MPLARLLPAALAAAVLPLGAPAAAGAHAAKAGRHGPVAHIALGIRGIAHARHQGPRARGPRAQSALGVVHTDFARRHHRRRRLHGRASSVCAGADTGFTMAAPAAMRAAVLCLVNDQRAAHGLPGLVENGRLDHSAQGWSNTMMRTGQFTHGGDFAARISAAGYDWQTAGENIATGYDTPRTVVAAWMASPGHCRNILNPSFADIGIGLESGAIGGGGGATWTQDFGLWMGQVPPSRDTAPMNACGA